jgi:hypothetical protein
VTEPGLRGADDRSSRGPNVDAPVGTLRELMELRASSPSWRVFAGCVIVVLAVGMLLHVTASGMTSIADQEKSSIVSKWTAFDTQQQCLRDAMTRAVPRGSRVLISQDQNTFLRLELAELSIPWVTPVDSRSQAAYEVVIVPGSECGGESLSAKAIR